MTMMTAIAPISCNRCPPNITTGSRERGANLSTRYSGIFGADGSTGSSRSSSDFGIRYTPKAQHHITTRVADDLLHSILGPGKGHKAYRGNGRNQSKSPCRATSLIVLHNLRGGDKNISYDIHTAAAMQMAITYLASRPPNF
jgi:hypothetical protein